MRKSKQTQEEFANEVEQKFKGNNKEFFWLTIKTLQNKTRQENKKH